MIWYVASKFRQIVLACLLAACFMLSYAYSSDQWVFAFGGPKNDYGYSVQPTKDGGFIVAGSTESFSAGNADVWLIKLESSGRVAWQKSYGGKRFDGAFAVQQLSDEGYAVAGVTQSFGAGRSDIWLLRLNASGNVIWQNTYGTRNTEIAEGKSFQQTKDGGFMLAGSIIYDASANVSETTHSDIWAMKLDANGLIIWQNRFNTSMQDVARSIEQTSDGGYIIAGYSILFSILKGNNYEFWVLKLDPSGNIAWQKSYGGKNTDQGYAIRQIKDNGYIAVGTTKSFGAGNYDYWILKLDSGGNLIWQKAYGGEKADIASSVIETADGGYLVSGTTESFGQGKQDALVMKLDASGKIMWQKVYGGKQNDTLVSVGSTGDEGYILAGSTDSCGVGKIDVLVIKTDESGSTGNPSVFFTQGYASVSDTSGQIAIPKVKTIPADFLRKDTLVAPNQSNASGIAPVAGE
jgi:hypothetical protein